MDESKASRAKRVTVHDRRRVGRDGEPAEQTPARVESDPSGARDAPRDGAESAPEAEAAKPRPDYLEDLRRLQAEFDNYRKRMMKEQANISERATARLVERLLPVLDNFERALEHDPVPGMELIYKELRDTLAAEGLAGIDATGQPFDPRQHDAVESHEDPSVTEAVCAQTYRTGYRFAGRVLRPAMVSVARPPEAAQAAGEARSGAAAGEPGAEPGEKED